MMPVNHLGECLALNKCSVMLTYKRVPLGSRLGTVQSSSRLFEPTLAS